MKQRAISLSLSFPFSFSLFLWQKRKPSVGPREAAYLRDDGMVRVRGQKNGFSSSWEFMSREEFSGKLKILLQSFITHFQGSSSLPSFIFISSLILFFFIFNLLRITSL